MESKLGFHWAIASRLLAPTPIRLVAIAFSASVQRGAAVQRRPASFGLRSGVVGLRFNSRVPVCGFLGLLAMYCVGTWLPVRVREVAVLIPGDLSAGP